MENKEIDIFNLIGLILKVLKKNILILSLFLAIGLIIGLLKEFTSDLNYKTTHIYLTNQHQMNEEVFKDLTSSFFKQNTTISNNADKFNINLEKIEPLGEDYYKIIFHTSHKSLSDSISNNLPIFIESLPYYNKNVKLRAKQLDQVITDLNKRIKQLKNTNYTYIPGEKGIVFNDSTFINEAFTDLYETKHNLETERINLKPAQLVYADIVEIKHISSILNIAKYGLIFVLIGVLFVFILQMLKISFNQI